MREGISSVVSGSHLVSPSLNFVRLPSFIRKGPCPGLCMQEAIRQWENLTSRKKKHKVKSCRVVEADSPDEAGSLYNSKQGPCRVSAQAQWTESELAYLVERCVLKNWPGEPESQNLRIGRCPAWTWSCGWLQKALGRKVCCGFSEILLNSFENQTQSREEELAQNGVGAQPGASACELPGGSKHSALHCRINLFFFFF